MARLCVGGVGYIKFKMTVSESTKIKILGFEHPRPEPCIVREIELEQGEYNGKIEITNEGNIVYYIENVTYGEVSPSYCNFNLYDKVCVEYDENVVTVTASESHGYVFEEKPITIEEIAKSIYESLSNTVSKAFDFLQNAISWAINQVIGVVSGIVSFASSLVSSGIEYLRTLLTDLTGVDIIGKLQSTVQGVLGFVDWFKEWISSVYPDLAGAMVSTPIAKRLWGRVLKRIEKHGSPFNPIEYLVGYTGVFFVSYIVYLFVSLFLRYLQSYIAWRKVGLPPRMGGGISDTIGVTDTVTVELIPRPELSFTDEINVSDYVEIGIETKYGVYIEDTIEVYDEVTCTTQAPPPTYHYEVIDIAEAYDSVEIKYGVGIFIEDVVEIYDEIVVELIKKEYCMVEPDEDPWRPLEGWDGWWLFREEAELDDFANAGHEYAVIDTYLNIIYFEPPADEYGYVKREDNDRSDRVALAMKIDFIDTTLVGIAWVELHYKPEYGTGEYVSVTLKRIDYNTLAIRDNISGREVSFANPDKCIILVVDRVDRKAIVYDRDKNKLAELDLQPEETAETKTYIEVREYNGVDEVLIDWVAYKKIRAGVVTVGDEINITDEVVVTYVTKEIIEIPLEDTIEVYDEASATLIEREIVEIPVEDTITVSDEISYLLIEKYTIYVEDTINIYDSVWAEIPKVEINVSEEINIADIITVTLIQKIIISLEDKVNVTDNVGIGLIERYIVISLEDKVNVSDEISISLEARPITLISVEDKINISDNVEVSLEARPEVSISLYDSVETFDTVSVSIEPRPSVSIGISDEVGIADTINVSLEPRPTVSITLSDEVETTDSTLISSEPRPTVSITLSDSISIEDSINVSLEPKYVEINVSDEVNVTDYVDITLQTTEDSGASPYDPPWYPSEGYYELYMFRSRDELDKLWNETNECCSIESNSCINDATGSGWCHRDTGVGTGVENYGAKYIVFAFKVIKVITATAGDLLNIINKIPTESDAYMVSLRYDPDIGKVKFVGANESEPLEYHTWYVAKFDQINKKLFVYDVNGNLVTSCDLSTWTPTWSPEYHAIEDYCGKGIKLYLDWIGITKYE